jgi:hypothetical protein
LTTTTVVRRASRAPVLAHLRPSLRPLRPRQKGASDGIREEKEKKIRKKSFFSFSFSLPFLTLSFFFSFSAK